MDHGLELFFIDLNLNYFGQHWLKLFLTNLKPDIIWSTWLRLILAISTGIIFCWLYQDCFWISRTSKLFLINFDLSIKKCHDIKTWPMDQP